MTEVTEATANPKVVYHAPQDVRVEPGKRPGIQDNEVLVEIEVCAICGTDIKSYFKGNPRIKPPMTIGHEFCGKIIEAGPSAKGYSIGQRVTMATSIGCGECLYCKRGKGNLCRKLQAIGFYYPGAMAKWLRVPAQGVKLKHLVDVGDLDGEIAALSEPLSCAINDITQVPREELQKTLIIGLGPLGLLHGLALRQTGVELLVGVEFPGKRLEMAAGMGFDNVLAPEELPETYRSLTDGEGFDLVIVAAPSGKAQSDALQYARKGGYVSFFASLPVGEEMLSINSRTIHYNELKVYGSSDSTPKHVHKAVEMLRSNPESFRRLVTHRLPFSHFTEAMDEIRTGNAVKVVLFPE